MSTTDGWIFFAAWLVMVLAWLLSQRNVHNLRADVEVLKTQLSLSRERLADERNSRRGVSGG